MNARLDEPRHVRHPARSEQRFNGLVSENNQGGYRLEACRPGLIATCRADALHDLLAAELGAKGVVVVLEATHTCMTIRGIRKPGARTTTSAVRGQLRDPATRAEAMSLIVG